MFVYWLHGAFFFEATSINDAGYSVEYFALLILIILSSNGYRITSSTFLENSGSSSKRNNLPHCNSLIDNHKAAEMTKICNIKPFTTIKIQIFLVNLKNNVEICENIILNSIPNDRECKDENEGNREKHFQKNEANIPERILSIEVKRTIVLFISGTIHDTES